METILNRRRKRPKPREKKTITCQFMGSECPFMQARDSGIFKNVAELKEDALRHLNPYQCKRCSRRFGKRFTKERHEKKGKPCVPVEGDGNTSPASLELQGAVSELEKAKGYDTVIAAIHKCKNICDGEPIRSNQNDRHHNMVNTEATRATGFSRPTSSPQGTTITNSMHSSPDYFVNWAPDSFPLLGRWTLLNATVLRGGAEWLGGFGDF